MRYLLFGEEGGVDDGRLVSDINAGHHLVTVHSPATTVEAGEQTSLLLLGPEIDISLLFLHIRRSDHLPGLDPPADVPQLVQCYH